MAAKSENQIKIETTDEQPIIPTVDKFWIVVLMSYLVVLGLISIWALIAFFPCDIAPENTASTCSKVVGFMFWDVTVSNEVRMILLILAAGAIGSLVHGYRSLFWYVGNRAFVRSWILMYFLLPFIGSSLSLVFYFVLRGGLFSPSATVDATSPFGFIGLAGLVGMFSNRAALKLQEVAESIFSTKESTKGKDNVDKEIIATANKADKEIATAEVKAEKEIAVAEVKADKEIAVAEVKADKEIAVAEVKAEKESAVAEVMADKDKDSKKKK